MSGSAARRRTRLGGSAARRLGDWLLALLLGTTASLEAQAAGSRLPGTMTIGRLHYDGGGTGTPILPACPISSPRLRLVPRSGSRRKNASLP